jgi:hypothetical protein
LSLLASGVPPSSLGDAETDSLNGASGTERTETGEDAALVEKDAPLGVSRNELR